MTENLSFHLALRKCRLETISPDPKRKGKHLIQEEVANYIGCCKATYHKMERGKHIPREALRRPLFRLFPELISH